jgi:hypothetical protein
LAHVTERTLETDTGIDQAGEEAHSATRQLGTIKKIVKVFAVFQGGEVLDRHDDAIRSKEGVEGKGIKVGTGVDDDNTTESGCREEAGKGGGVSQ